jgi:hypothetical protein
MLVSLKPVLRGRIWDKEKWSYKTGDLVNKEKDDICQLKSVLKDNQEI